MTLYSRKVVEEGASSAMAMPLVNNAKNTGYALKVRMMNEGMSTGVKWVSQALLDILESNSSSANEGAEVSNTDLLTCLAVEVHP